MPDALQVIAGIIAIVSMVAGVVGYFKANVSKATIELYKEDNTALRLRIDTLEKTADQNAERIRVLEAARNTLLDVVTQAQAIAELHRVIALIANKLDVHYD